MTYNVFDGTLKHYSTNHVHRFKTMKARAYACHALCPIRLHAYRWCLLSFSFRETTLKHCPCFIGLVPVLILASRALLLTRAPEGVQKCVDQKGFDAEGVEIESGVERGEVWGGGRPPLQNFFLIFRLKPRALPHPERHCCQVMLAGYSDYSTIFAGQADMLKRKWTKLHDNWQLAKKKSPFATWGNFCWR